MKCASLVLTPLQILRIKIMIKYWVSLALIFLVATIQAQSTRNITRSIDEIYAETDPILEGISMEVPEEFQSASAVALAIISSENFIAKTNKRVRTSYHRILIKINDKAARDEFSVFTNNNKSFRYLGFRDERIYALRIIKPSGEKIDLDIESLEKNANNEIAIPNLEIGDILDTGLKVVETITIYYCYSPIFKTLNHDIPVVYGYMRYNVDHSFYVNSLSQNGAPKLERNESLCSATTRVFDLEYSNLKPLSGEIWAPISRTEKTVKIQVCYYPTSNTYGAPMILGEPHLVKSSSNDNEKVRAFRKTFRFSSTKDANVKYFRKWYKKNFPQGTVLSNEEYMNYAYYHFRYYTLIFSLTNNSFNENYQNQYINSGYFVKLMKQAALEKNIPFEVVFSTNKEISNFDDGLLMSEFYYIIRYKTEADEWNYMENPTAFQTTGYFNPSFQGQDGMALGVGNNMSFSRITIPSSEAEDNLYRISFLIDLNLETKHANIDATSTSTGIFKSELSRTALYGVEFHIDAMEAMLPEGQADVMMAKGKVQRGMQKTASNVEKDSEEKLIMMKKLRSEEYDIDEYTSFELFDSGVKSDNDSLIYTEKYSIIDVVEKAGPSYIINLSKIALDQISFTDEEKLDRINDVYLNYPKTYEYIYRINVPEGYQAFGLESFKESVYSKYGSVEMTAGEKDNQVIVYLKKVYKKSFIPKEEWPAMMEFLEPAMKINDARIVLKKI